eukprot:7265303-Ditylum_brightwellii.AAC.2
MKAHAALELVKDAKYHREFIVRYTDANNDSPIKALLRYSYTELVANDPGYAWSRLCPKSLAHFV